MNKKAEGYVSTCIIIIVICLLISLFITFAAVVSTVRINKRNVRNCLDSFVTENSVEIYNSVKTGENTLDEILADNFITKLSDYCSLTKNGNTFYYYDKNGNEQYRISVPEAVFIEEHTLQIAVEYTLTIPMYFGNRNLTQASVPITIKSRFKNKY